MTSNLTDAFIQLLNEMLELDPRVTHVLLNGRVPCSKGIADHPYIVVEDVQTPQGAVPVVGVLGIINGALDKIGQAKVAMVINENSSIASFTCYQPVTEEKTHGEGGSPSPVQRPTEAVCAEL